MIYHLFIIAIAINLVLMYEIAHDSFFKVPNMVFDDTEHGHCFIGSTPRRSALKTECLAACSGISRCFLACFNETSCLFYRSMVSFFWDPSVYLKEEQLKELRGHSCYSSYQPHGDITDRVVAIRAVENPMFPKEQALDGYICHKTYTNYASGYSPNPWIEFEFDHSYPIREVVVYTRYHPELTTCFQEVEVRVGDNPGEDGNFETQSFFGFYQGEADVAEVVTFRSDAPLIGKYLSVKIVGATKYLIIHEIKVLV